MSARILIVDDDAGYARALQRSLAHEGHEVAIAVSAQDARQGFERLSPEVVILDYQLPDADGLVLLDELRARGTGAVFLLNTAYPDLDLAVDAMRRGAFDFLAKDSQLREHMLRISRAIEVARLRRRVVEAGKTSGDQGLLGTSPPMVALQHRLEALASSDRTTAFIVGETGVGKGVVARQIHARSGRAFEPLVAVDCTTIPATLVESELFGHEKGAFSGATHSKLGRVEMAGRGTLFLDEIGELELSVQTKLLRLLEEREFTRVGGTKARQLEARIITATNRDLERAVAEGRFRADLRYRLEVFVVEIPPLRARGDDIPLLAAHFAQERARGLGRSPPVLDEEVLAAMSRYAFPGNVRELANMVEQAVLLSGDARLTLDAFPVLTRARARASREPPAAEEAGPTGTRRDPSERAEPTHAIPTPTSASLALASPALASPTPSRTGPARTSATPTAEPATSPPPGEPETSVSPGTTGLSAIRLDHEQRERAIIVAALEQTGGNVAAAARQLGYSRFQVLRRLAKYGLR